MDPQLFVENELFVENVIYRLIFLTRCMPGLLKLFCMYICVCMYLSVCFLQCMLFCPCTHMSKSLLSS